MAFISNYEKEGLVVRGTLVLTKDAEVLRGTFTKGSKLKVISLPEDNDYRGEFLCRDIESGETVYLSRVLGGYAKA